VEEHLGRREELSKVKVYYQDFNNVLSFLKKREDIEIVEDARDSDCIVLWQDVRGYLQELAEINKEYMHKPLVVVQHGRAATNDYLAPNNFKCLADKVCCWGERDRLRLVKAGYPDVGVVTGSPLVPYLTEREKHDGKNVVFVPIITTHEEPDNILAYWKLKQIELGKSSLRLKKSYDNLRDAWNAWEVEPTSATEGSIPYYNFNKDWRLIAKITYLHDKRLYMGDVVQTLQSNKNHMSDCIKLLSLSDCVVGLEEGTFQLLAMAMGIPCVMVEGFQYKELGGIDYSTVDMVKTKAVRRVNLSEIEETIDKELANPDALKEEREKVLRNEFWDGKTDPIENIINVIKGVTNAC
jgi:hypothetical protein